MQYVTITTWELMNATDFELIIRQVSETRLPALIALGATRVQLVQTSERTIAAISTWPDQPTRDAAALAIQKVRESIRSEDLSRMTGEMGGKVVAALSAETPFLAHA